MFNIVITKKSEIILLDIEVSLVLSIAQYKLKNEAK